MVHRAAALIQIFFDIAVGGLVLNTGHGAPKEFFGVPEFQFQQLIFWLQIILSFFIAGAAFRYPDKKLLYIFDLKPRFLQTFNDTKRFQLIIAEITDVSFTLQIREKTFLVIIS